MKHTDTLPWGEIADLMCGRRRRAASVLTERQQEVLMLTAQGLTVEEMAERMGLAVSTVKMHLDNMLTALGARNRAHAVYLAMVSGQMLEVRA